MTSEELSISGNSSTGMTTAARNPKRIRASDMTAATAGRSMKISKKLGFPVLRLTAFSLPSVLLSINVQRREQVALPAV